MYVWLWFMGIFSMVFQGILVGKNRGFFRINSVVNIFYFGGLFFQYFFSVVGSILVYEYYFREARGFTFGNG